MLKGKDNIIAGAKAWDDGYKTAMKEVFDLLNKQASYVWLTEQLEKEILKHNSPASNILSVASTVRYNAQRLHEELLCKKTDNN